MGGKGCRLCIISMGFYISVSVVNVMYNIPMLSHTIMILIDSISLFRGYRPKNTSINCRLCGGYSVKNNFTIKQLIINHCLLKKKLYIAGRWIMIHGSREPWATPRVTAIRFFSEQWRTRLRIYWLLPKSNFHHHHHHHHRSARSVNCTCTFTKFSSCQKMSDFW